MAGTVPDIGTMVIQMKETFTSLGGLVSSELATTTGFALVAVALWRAYKMSGDHHQMGVGHLVTPLVIGGMFLSWGHSLNMVTQSLGLDAGTMAGGKWSGALGYMPASGTSEYAKNVIEASMTAVSALGAIAIFRGLLQWKAAGEGEKGQGDPIWQGLWHIVGGGLALNISGFLKMLGFQ